MTHRLDSALLNYIVEQNLQPGAQLPSLNELSARLNINVAKLREQLEVARALGFVDVRPRRGIRFREYDFLPALRLSLLFALALDKTYFIALTELRNHLEVAFWHEAVARLTDADKAALGELCRQAWQKLNNQPFIQIPHQEHRKFHMGIFAHLDNPFVKGLLEAYWEAYEAVELNTYADLAYWQEAWTYHEKILNHILENNPEAALQAFIEHTQLLRHRNGANAPANAFFRPSTQPEK
ncbi:MAG: FadR family transcriptional regulator [Chloroflexi bacterium]|jgi:DNA-binding FadR family transcriptional regulator|nr:FadR family transcriptional regulator [Chloroflexota bacterium]